ncbi:pre-mrna processing protein prp39-related [Holotrichia oblita]|uniref:Pre-mrna processing protein prp39-related n=1 Tax=Holotrichia oblita TaxID=644536 RepID=A0ACB9TPP3_HOLOL|nr:pre-mrna processing protein prp39-related [Holotrichia oblita]
MEEENIVDEEIDSLSSSEDEDDKASEQRAAELEDQLSQNMYLYDVHVELVGLYRKVADLTSMRAAYERFHKYFPITPKLWLNWIHDEMQIADSSEEKNFILQLFNKAMEDYHSVQLWQEYAQFAIGFCSVDEVRAILERGLNSVGLHVSDGSLLWDTLREFELAHLSLAEAGTEDFGTQLLRVVEIYRRQLSVPLLDMEKTYKEWEDFIQQLPDDHGIDVKQVEWGYKKAQQLLESYKPYEESLTFAKNEDEMYKVYFDYIDFVKDPSLKVVLYERAVCELCLNAQLWENYCYYTLKLGEIALKVSERALRNCPWHVSLWITRLRILEVLQKPKEDLTACFEEAIKSVPVIEMLDLWFAYIEYIKRNSDDMELFDKLILQAKQQLEPDQKFKILRFQARIHAKNNDISGARKIWSEIMSNVLNKSSAYTWIEYLEIEKRFGESKFVRQIYQRAISNCKDWQHYFADEWLMYEREVGTIDDVLKCVKKCKEIVKYIREDNTLTQGKDSKRKFDDEDDKYNQSKRHKVNQVHPKYKSESNPKDEPMKEHRRKPVKIQHPPTNIDTEKTVFLSNFISKVTENEFKNLFPNAKEIIIPTDRKGNSKCFAYVLFETADEAAEALKRDRLPIDGRPLFISKCQKDRTQRQPVFKYSGKSEGNKLFVKGLPNHYTKERIEELFKPYKCIDVRLVVKFNGQPRGLAYVDFDTKEDAELAMKNTDQMVLGEHTITVAVSAPPNKKKEALPFTLPVSKTPSVRNSKTKLEIPFVPRSVQVKRTEPKEVPNLSKTNDEFRKMLLDK